ncbi:MAG: aminoglycoside phosphotransferase family protein, partial [Acetatifactor sp.]|nr:aminoglycoside phosphotransferase family protein [Acetatifactor sp.]
KYCRPERHTINTELIQKITKTLAALHTDAPPSFMCKDQEKAEALSDQMITECLCGWKSVLAEYPGSFNENQLEEIAGKINNLIAWHDSEDRVLIHGDFHWDNLLEDENGNILLCDWQGVNLGGASGDLSFFLSRLGGDGIRIDAAVFLDYYVNAIWKLSGKQIQRQDIIRHMNAANVITSFLFWHQYLHGSSEERVRDIYGKMTKDFKGCNLNLFS